MKSKRSLTAIATALALAVASGLLLAHGNEVGSAKATLGNTKVSIDFHRPTLKGRDVMKLIHPGDLWRMGADIPTTIETDGDLDFGGTRVPKGKYFLMARYVEPGKWTLVVSTKSRQAYEPSTKLAEIPMAVADGQSPMDAMDIQLTGKGTQGNLVIAWGTFRLSASFAAVK
jgi:membrane fusion protein, copper/silver efflux system